MATNPSNLYDGFNFLVEIDGVPVVAFAECTLPSITIESAEYREGSDIVNNAHDVPGLVKYGDLTLKRGLANSASTTALFEWINGFVQGKGTKREVKVQLLDSQRNPAISWSFSNCWPTKWEAPALNAKTSSIAIETLVVSVDGVSMASGATT